MDSFNSNDWTNTPHGSAAPAGDAFGGGYGGAPTKRPEGSGLPLEQIQLKRHDQPMDVLGGALSSAMEAFKAHPLEILLFTVLLPIGSSFILSMLSAAIDVVFGVAIAGADSDVQTGVRIMLMGKSLVVVFLQVLLSLIFQFFTISASLRALRGQELSIKTVLTQEKSGAMVAIVLTSILVFLAGIAGYILFVIPGIIILLGMLFTSHVIVDKNIKYIDAMKASWELMDGHKLMFCLYSLLVSLGGVVIAFVTCGLGALFLIPFMTLWVCAVYNSVAAPGNAYLQDGEGVSSVFE